MDRKNQHRKGVHIIYLLGNGEAMTDEQEIPTQENVEFDDDVIDSLNTMTLVADDQESEETASDDASSLNSGSLASSNQEVDTNVGNLWMVDDTAKQSNRVTIKESVLNEEPTSVKQPKKKIFKNPIKLLRKFSQGEIQPPLMIEEPDLDSVTIDSLPQHFVTKYLGRKSCTGLQGAENIRRPIDRMVRDVTGNKQADELPLVQLTVWPKGLQATLHPKSKNKNFEPFYLPIDFISFCSEHGHYQKIVGMITVTQIGPKTTKTECHAYVCHSAVEARKLTVSMATAFKMFAESLNGSQVKFKVDLRSKEEQRRKNQQRKEFEA